jgi:hypothetical protein
LFFGAKLLYSVTELMFFAVKLLFFMTEIMSSGTKLMSFGAALLRRGFRGVPYTIAVSAKEPGRCPHGERARGKLDRSVYQPPTMSGSRR